MPITAQRCDLLRPVRTRGDEDRTEINDRINAHVGVKELGGAFIVEVRDPANIALELFSCAT